MRGQLGAVEEEEGWGHTVMVVVVVGLVALAAPGHRGVRGRGLTTAVAVCRPPMAARAFGLAPLLVVVVVLLVVVVVRHKALPCSGQRRLL